MTPQAELRTRRRLRVHKARCAVKFVSKGRVSGGCSITARRHAQEVVDRAKRVPHCGRGRVVQPLRVDNKLVFVRSWRQVELDLVDTSATDVWKRGRHESM